MSNDYCTNCGTSFDWDVSPDGCPTCETTELHTVELITYDALTSGRAPWLETHWGVAQWIEAGQATAIGHWNVWAYKSDMFEAMTEAMDNAKQGGRWALACPTPKGE